MSRRLFKSTLITGSMTFLSRISGLIRDVLQAKYFGAGAAMDAFLVAFKIPNFFRRMFAEASFAYAFVPVLSEYKTQRSHAEVQELVDKVAGALASVLFLITIIGVVAAPLFIMLFSPTWYSQHPDKFTLAATMLMLTFPYLLFISLTALAGGLLNAYNKFWVPAFTPVLMNIAMIGCAVWLTPYLEPITYFEWVDIGPFIMRLPYSGPSVVSLAWGVFLAGVIQLLFQIPYLKKIGIIPRPKWDWKHEGVRRIIKLMGPTLISSSVLQISLLIDIWLATALATGSVSWLFYADRMVEFPLGVFGIALATVILPSLSRSYAEKSEAQFSRTLDWSLRWVMLIGIPATIALMVMAGPLITTVYFRDQFTALDVLMTSLALMGYAIGLLGFILVKVLAPGYYARHDSKTPMRAAVIALSSKVILSLVFIGVLLLFGFNFNSPGLHISLALATALGSMINSWILYHWLRRDNHFRPESGWLLDFTRISAAAIFMGCLLFWFTPSNVQWMAWGSLWRVLNLGAYVGLGLLSYFAALLIFGLKPWRWKSGT